MLKVGQKLWFVGGERYSGSPHEVTITKIGRKWATIGEGWNAERIDMQTLHVDGKGYSSPACCYLSKESYEQTIALCNLWGKFYKAVNRLYLVPDGVSEDDINKAVALLKIKLL